MLYGFVFLVLFFNKKSKYQFWFSHSDIFPVTVVTFRMFPHLFGFYRRKAGDDALYAYIYYKKFEKISSVLQIVIQMPKNALAKFTKIH